MNLELPFIDDDNCIFDDIPTISKQESTGGQPVSNGEGSLQLREDISKFISGLQLWYKNFKGRQLDEDIENDIRKLISGWNTFLHEVDGIQETSPIISSDIRKRISEFIPCCQYEGKDGEMIRRWLSEWNIFLQARQGKAPVSKLGVFATAFGILLYVVDMMSDIATAIYYGHSGKWWQCVVTLLVVYAAVAVSTVWKWATGGIRWTSPLSRLRYIGSLFVNLPDLLQCWTMLNLEWELSTSPKNNAYLVPEYQQSRRNVALLKFTEGLWEACPQTILQICLLLPELNGDITWTGYLRIASAMLSLWTAGAALANQERYFRIRDNNEVFLRELILLLVSAVPVTVSRLMSVALLLSVHLFVGLGCIILHVLIYWLYLFSSKRFPGTRDEVLIVCLIILKFLISPFNVVDSIAAFLIRHAIHFVCNTSVTLVWAFSTQLMCINPALYTSIIAFNLVMFSMGTLSGVLYKKYWLL